MTVVEEVWLKGAAAFRDGCREGDLGLLQCHPTISAWYLELIGRQNELSRPHPRISLRLNSQLPGEQKCKMGKRFFFFFFKFHMLGNSSAFTGAMKTTKNIQTGLLLFTESNTEEKVCNIGYNIFARSPTGI